RVVAVEADRLPGHRRGRAVQVWGDDVVGDRDVASRRRRGAGDVDGGVHPVAELAAVDEHAGDGPGHADASPATSEAAARDGHALGGVHRVGGESWHVADGDSVEGAVHGPGREGDAARGDAAVAVDGEVLDAEVGAGAGVDPRG